MSLPNIPPNPKKRLSVMVFERDDMTRSFLCDLLEEAGFAVSLAANSRSASEMLRRTHPPKIIFLDCSTDSVEFCRTLRAEARDYYPYVFMTATTGHKRDVALALESGADDYLTRPFDRTELRARLSVAFRILKVHDDLIHACDDLRARATTDSLTGLFNRAAFLDLFEREVDRAARSRSRTGLLLLDLDHFKDVNDKLGHTAGDEVLKEVAKRLKRAVRFTI